MALILVVDDSAFMRGKISSVMKAEGHTVMEAGDGITGLQMALSHEPDCLILDIIMPELDGLKILRNLHDRGMKIPVVIVTADIQLSVQKQCLALGAAAFINKPPQERELMNAVREVLSTQKKGAPVRQAEPHHIDALKELINIGVGRAAASLNQMLKLHVSLEVPFVKVLSPIKFKQEMKDLGDEKLAAVKIGFQGPFSGTSALVVTPGSIDRLVNVLVGKNPVSREPGSAGAETLQEVGNIVINCVLGSLGNILKQSISFSLPEFSESTVKQIFFSEKIGNETVFLLVRTRFKIREIEIEGNIILLFTVGSFDILLSAIDEMK